MPHALKGRSLSENGSRRNKLEVAMKSKKDNILTSRIYVEYEKEREIDQ